MKEAYTTEAQNKKVEELHWETQQWRSKLHFMQDEILFIERLLNSYVFQPNTLNLFERLQDYQRRLHKAKDTKAMLLGLIAKHEGDLGGMLECTDESCDLGYYQKHDKLKAEVVMCLQTFQELKSGIFNYAGGILKRRKPSK
ncbi:MAG: hypothetical protein ACR2MT_16700 [Aurantibacter sp.]